MLEGNYEMAYDYLLGVDEIKDSIRQTEIDNAFNESIPSGASDEPVIGSFISSNESKPRVVTPPVNKMTTKNPLIGILLIPPHT